MSKWAIIKHCFSVPYNSQSSIQIIVGFYAKEVTSYLFTTFPICLFQSKFDNAKIYFISSNPWSIICLLDEDCKILVINAGERKKCNENFFLKTTFEHTKFSLKNIFRHVLKLGANIIFMKLPFPNKNTNFQKVQEERFIVLYYIDTPAHQCDG